jgi:GNAT superfamily N-acetyltransferase
MQVRPFAPSDYPALVSVHQALGIVWPEKPRSAEAWEQSDRARPAESHHLRWVAVVAGQVVGFAACDQNPWNYPPRSFQINVEVHPDHQRRGIGAALYDQVMDGLRAFDPPALRADAFTNLPQGYTFLQARGFREVFRETPVHLDVRAFDASPYAGLNARLLSSGIVIKTLRELEGDPQRDRKIYDLYWAASADMPQEGDGEARPDFDDWLGWGLHDPTILPDAYFIATRGDEYIGLRELGSYSDPEVLLGGLLGVRREYRRGGVGLAMQLRGIAYAREHGFRLLKTCTAIQNAPMQALFNKLGYERDPEWQQCQKDIGR